LAVMMQIEILQN